MSPPERTPMGQPGKTPIASKHGRAPWTSPGDSIGQAARVPDGPAREDPMGQARENPDGPAREDPNEPAREDPRWASHFEPSSVGVQSSLSGSSATWQAALGNRTQHLRSPRSDAEGRCRDGMFAPRAASSWEDPGGPNRRASRGALALNRKSAGGSAGPQLEGFAVQ